LHSYTLPCVVALPIAGGDPDYRAWLLAETAPPPGSEGAEPDGKN
jgi:periplasmic divalent cation tolerance protein